MTKIDLMLLTPISEEYAEISKLVESPIPVKEAKRPAISGKIASFSTICILLGKGQARAAATLQYFCDKWKPRWIILLGVAGGISANKVCRGDIVIASFVYGIDFGKIENGKYIRRPEYDVTIDETLLSYAEAFKTTNSEWKNSITIGRPDNKSTAETKVHIGYIASGDKVVDDPKYLYFRDATSCIQEFHAVEMESIGVGASVKLEQTNRAVGLFIVRGISDEIDSNTEKQTDKTGSSQRKQWKFYASAAAIGFVNAFLHYFASSYGNNQSTNSEEVSYPKDDCSVAELNRYQILITLRGSINQFNNRKKSELTIDLIKILEEKAGKLNYELKISSITEGSVIVSYNLPYNHAKILIKAINNSELRKYGIMDVSIRKVATNEVLLKKHTDSIQNANILYSQEQFEALLQIEQRRAERSRGSFVLLLINIANFIPRSIREKKRAAVLDRLSQIISIFTREVDIKGWYSTNEIIGIIYIDTSVAFKDVLMDKCSKAIDNAFGEEPASLINYQVFVFPNTNQEQWELAFKTNHSKNRYPNQNIKNSNTQQRI